MNGLNSIISSFSAEEQQRFIVFLEKRNKRVDTKNIQLFKLAQKGETSTKLICEALYGAQKREAFYTLKQRLYESLIDFVANNKIQGENSVDMLLIKYVLAARDFLLHKNNKAGYKILDKAEIIAKEHQLFPILNEIYHTKIQYAHTIPSIDFNKTVAYFKENQRALFLEEELNIVYAKVRHALKINTHKHTLDFESLINKLFKEHRINIQQDLSFKSLYQLIAIVNISAFIHNDYLKTEVFLTETYNILTKKKGKEKQVFYHIRVLFVIANTFFRNKKFNESLTYLDSMHGYMLQHKKKYFNRFYLNYNLLLALNYNYTNKQETAIKLLETVLQKKHSDIKTILEIKLSLITFYFQSNEFKKAMQLYSKFYHSDQWYIDKAGVEWTIKKNLIEILLHLELQNIDLFESRLLSFKRKHIQFLLEINQKRVITFLKLVEQYYKNPASATTSDFFDLVERSFVFVEAKQEDIFVMSFYAWLKSKMIQQPIYEVTLALIEKVQLQSTH
ncbi:hypothetical protein P8625_04870 [Tenacibaculum tangerinum]|uniref:Tetratricopeptide repeat protein n=1 Tax=Tenacibaculum tangerinum TaxID=3038772 RepID=A0ABY8L530_9FLAO|nr:hypothetical protein [Tenacibaculum tangerinum]WGH76495.1 hypothetical protein P8625_04870 [Tenacibaculum tangerinum]